MTFSCARAPLPFWKRWWLRFWAFVQLGKVDSQLQQLATTALIQASVARNLPILSPNERHQIDLRVSSITWAARFHPCRPRCLHRSVVLYLWLQKKGIPANLQIGWGEGIGHAWVSYGDEVLNDRPDIETLTPSLRRWVS
jgi:hypothetical protein